MPSAPSHCIQIMWIMWPIAWSTVWLSCHVLLCWSNTEWLCFQPEDPQVAVCQKRTNWQQNLWNSQSRTPVVFKDVQADDSLTIDVAVIDSGAESNLWWLKWIIGWKCDIQKKHTTFIYRTWWTKYSRSPFINVISFRPSTAVRRRIKGYFS